MQSTLSIIASQGTKVGKVLNVRDIPQGILPANTVFIDKGSKWANPFTIGIHGDRDEVCDLFDEMLANNLTMLRELDELKGMNLASFHAGYRSHGDTLAALAAVSYRDRLAWADRTLTRLGKEELPLAA